MNYNPYPNLDRYAQKNRQNEELESMGMDPRPVSPGAPQSIDEFLNENPAQGMLKIQATVCQTLPVPGVHIIVSKRIGEETRVFLKGQRMRAASSTALCCRHQRERARKSPSSRTRSHSTISMRSTGIPPGKSTLWRNF